MVIVCLSKANATTITNQCLLSSQPNSTQRHSFMKKAVIWRYCVKKGARKIHRKNTSFQPANLSKRGSDRGVFQSILRNF